jgi:hypothetical protein
VLAELGYDSTEIDALHERGAVGITTGREREQA